MALFRMAEPIFIPSSHLDVTFAWYRDKLAMREAVLTPADDPRSRILEFDKGDAAITVGPAEETALGPARLTPAVPIIYAKNVGKAFAALQGRGAEVHPIKKDIQGTKYFEFLDCDGNLLEVSEEP